jgi:CHASE2 domain-containing sensor protein
VHAPPPATAKVREKLAALGWSHWIIASLVIVVGMLTTRYADEYLRLDRARDALSQKLLEWSWRSPQPGDVKVVLIEDDEYWYGAPAGRVPIKRSYLADLVDALDQANAQVIALDFDMRLPHPPKLEDFPIYQEESLRLAKAVGAAAKRHKVVLSKTIHRAEDGHYGLEPDVYQLYGLCTQLDRDGHWKHAGTAELPLDSDAAQNINCGYIVLNTDRRELPAQEPLADGTQLDSFSLAVARAHNPDRVADTGTQLRYASYIPANKLAPMMYSAHGVLTRDPRVLSRLNGQTVIVGGGWSSFAAGRGRKIDLHDTPVGEMNGAVVHANFAEAFLDGRAYYHVPAVVTLSLEALLGLAAAMTFALFPSPLAKFLSLVSATVVLTLIEWLTLNLFGLFLEVFIPFVGVWVHSLIEGFLAEAPGHQPAVQLSGGSQ